MFLQKSDAELVRRVLAGRQENFEELVRRYFPVAQAVAAARVSNAHDVEDLVQEAFLRAYQGLDNLRKPAQFGAWLGSIVRNLCSNYHRARKLREASADVQVEVMPAEPFHERQELRHLVISQLQDLEENAREVLLLHYFAEKSTREIAGLLGISRAAVKKRLQRARETLERSVLEALAPDPAALQTRKQIVQAIVASLPALGGKGMAAATAEVAGGAFLWAVVKGCALALGSVVVFGTVYLGGCNPGALPARQAADPAGPQTVFPTPPPAARSASRPATSASEQPDADNPVPASGSISGQVIETLSQSTLAGVEVRLRNSASQHALSAQTDEGGRYLFNNLRSGKYEVAVADRRYVGEPSNVSLSEESELSGLQLHVSLGAIVSGRVYDKETGEGVPGIRIYARHGSAETTSGVDGRYSLGSLYAQEQSIWRGFRGSYAAMTRREAKEFHLEAGAHLEGVDFPMDRGLAVAGRVVDGKGRGRPHVTLCFSIPEMDELIVASSDLNGQFSASNLPHQLQLPYTLSSEDLSKGLALQPNQTVVLGSEDLRGVSVTVEEGALLSGRIVAGAAGVAGAKIICEVSAASGPTAQVVAPESDDNGRFQSVPLYPGTYELWLEPRARAAGESSTPQALGSLTVKAGEIRSGLVYRYLPEAGLTISGRIVDEQGLPLPGVWFAASKEGGGHGPRTKSDENGLFIIGGLEEAIYSLSGFQWGNNAPINRHYQYLAGSQEVEIALKTASEPADEDLRPTGTTVVRVLNAETQQPLTNFGYFASAENTLDDLWNSVSLPLQQAGNSEGVLEIPVDGRQCVLLLMTAGFGTKVTVVPPGSDQFTVEMEPGASIEGVVLDASGNPVPGALILRGALKFVYQTETLRLGHNSEVLDLSQSGGRFAVGDLSSEAMLLCAASKRHGVVSKWVTPANPPAQVVLQFPATGTLRGIITDAGQAKSGVFVHATAPEDIGEMFETQTDAEGRYSIEGMKSGEYQVYCGIGREFPFQISDFRKERIVQVAAGQSTEWDEDFPRGDARLFGVLTVDGAAPDQGFLTVQVTYGGMGLVCDFRVPVYEGGVYWIEGLLAGSATVEFQEKRGYKTLEPQLAQVEVPEAGAIELNAALFHLPPGK